MTLDNGTRFSPTYIENKLKFCPYIKDAVVTGGGKPFIAALVSLDYALTGKWAEDHGVSYTTYADLSQKPDVYDLITRDIRQVNKRLPKESRIKRIALLHKELDADDAELTRTRKLRRGYVGGKYSDFIDAIYSGASEYLVKTEVSYRGTDDRKTSVATVVRIVDLEETK